MKPDLFGLGIRSLAGLAVGTLAGLSIWHSGLGVIFLGALFGGAALLSIGLGGSRLLVSGAILLGQYLVFHWRSMPSGPLSPEVAAPLFITRSLFIFIPGLAITTGAYVGFVAERILGERRHHNGTVERP